MKKLKLLIIASLLSTATYTLADETTAKLTINGSATLSKPADQLLMSLSVVTQSADAKSALSQNNEEMQNVMASLKQLGLKKDEYQTGQFTISPIYSRRAKDASEEWTPTITAYRVTNSIQIQTPQIEQAGAIIDSASKAGVNAVADISFSLQNPNSYRTEAIEAATKQAHDDALALAKSAEVQLKRILSIQVDQTPEAPMYKGRLMLASPAGGSPSTSIEAGTIDVSANVTIIYEIDQ